MTKLKEGDIVRIDWRDASTSFAQYKKEKYDPTCTLHTVGIFVKYDEKYICLAAQKDNYNPTEYRCWFSIPKACVKKIRRYGKV